MDFNLKLILKILDCSQCEISAGLKNISGCSSCMMTVDSGMAAEEQSFHCLWMYVHGLDLASLVCADSTMSMGTFPILSHPFLIMTERSTTLLIYVVSFSLALVNCYDDANEVMNL